MDQNQGDDTAGAADLRRIADAVKGADILSDAEVDDICRQLDQAAVAYRQGDHEAVVRILSDVNDQLIKGGWYSAGA